MTKAAVIIGRFQTPYLHPGHLWLIANALRECEEVSILLGCPKDDRLDERNPYTFLERYYMIKRIFPNVDILTLHDVGDDRAWSKHVDARCKALEEYDYEVTLYHSRDSFKTQYTGRFPTREVPEIERYSATKIRQQSTNDTGPR